MSNDDSIQVAGNGVDFLENVKSILKTRINNILQYEEFISNPVNVEELHDLRKAMKQFRYTLESFQPIYSEFSNHINNAKSIQDSLGLIHDCDVWMEDIPVFIKKEKEKTRNFYGNLSSFSFLMPGFLYLISDRQRIRSAEYEKFVAKWIELKNMDYWTQVINFKERG